MTEIFHPEKCVSWFDRAAAGAEKPPGRAWKMPMRKIFRARNVFLLVVL